MKSFRWNKLYWLGAIGVMIAPFFIDTLMGKAIIIIALSILSTQAYRARLHNLVLANIVSIVGYIYVSMRMIL